MNLVETSEQVTELHHALALLQDRLGAVSKDASNAHMRYTYATIGAVLDAVRPHLKDLGLAVMQPSVLHGRTATVHTRLTHSSGQWLAFDSSADFTERKGLTDTQVGGMALTYLRRYALVGLFCLAVEDSDAAEVVSPPRNESRGGGRREEPRREAAQEQEQEQPHAAERPPSVRREAVRALRDRLQRLGFLTPADTWEMIIPKLVQVEPLTDLTEERAEKALRWEAAADDDAFRAKVLERYGDSRMVRTDDHPTPDQRDKKARAKPAPAQPAAEVKTVAAKLRKWVETHSPMTSEEDGALALLGVEAYDLMTSEQGEKIRQLLMKPEAEVKRALLGKIDARARKVAS